MAPRSSGPSSIGEIGDITEPSCAIYLVRVPIRELTDEIHFPRSVLISRQQGAQRANPSTGHLCQSQDSPASMVMSLKVDDLG